MKKKPKLTWILFFAFILMTFMALIVSGGYAFWAMRNFFYKQSAVNLEISGELIKAQILDHFLSHNWAAIDAICKSAGAASRSRITVISQDGTVIGDSYGNPQKLENHASRPEIQGALAGKTAMHIRFSITMQKKMMYVAIPFHSSGRISGVIRTSLAITTIENHIRTIRNRILIAGIILFLMASILSLWISRRISKPLEAMKKGADRFAAEDLDYRLPIANTEEMADLSEAMNRMAQELRRRMVKITEQHNEIESILASMFEGLIALDNEVRIINVNRAAQEILGISWNPQANSDLLGLVRNPGFEQLIKEIASTEALIEKDLSLFRPEEKIIHINGSPIYSSDGNRSGSLLILNDVTHLRRLENIRQDFAANVSHELKTPLTAVKGFVETLIHGDLEKTDEAKRFLTIIAKHVNRLEAIVEDLLMLARIEQGKEATRIGKQKHPVQEVLKKAVELRKSEAHAKGIKIELTGDSTLWMKMDILLFEQAVANLIDNAIKYSPDGSVVRVESRMEGSELKLLFQDEGIGIEKKHIPRIFERFYRVDKARSRKLGGTGLGLAIVKHIVQAHGGRIYVESIPGKGSTFTLLFPASEVEISTSKSNSFI